MEGDNMKKNHCKNALIIQDQHYPIKSEKLLVGSAPHCDIRVDHDSISFYQAMIFADPSGNIVVMDLDSHNGTYINGIKIGTKTSLFEGDTLTLGKIHCEVTELFEEAQFESREVETKVYEDLQDLKVYIPEQNKETEVLIDDEYCDIVFDDQNFIPNAVNPLNQFRISESDYVATEDLEEGFDIAKEKVGNCVQITTTLNGNMLEQYYYELQDGSIKASRLPLKNNVVIDVLSAETEIPFIKLNNGRLEVQELEGFHVSQKSMELTGHDVIVITCGTYQVFVEVARVPHTLVHISSLRRDKNFYQDTAKKFAAVILPMLLLLLVDFSIEKKKPLKQLSIIYKKPTNANVNNKKMASENPSETKKDTGHKKQKQPDKKIAHSKAGEKAQPKKAQAQKVAKANNPSKAKPKTKAYKFDMAANVNSMFSKSKTASVTNNQAVSSVKTTSNVTGSLNTKVNGTSKSKVGTMGKDSAGRALASYGSKGLSSKAGRNTAYIQTETVVLGSMDPELLRKILQQYLPQFRHCYQQELAYNSEDIKGIVDLNFEISAGGKVGKIQVRPKDSRFSKKGTNCMAGVLAIIDFPKPKGGGRVAVRQPLSFFSEKEKG
ncbi:MAG: hypothetical protein CME62_09120 [Halobacteriovoraceae bacterium]|nr:hypothetical protein [Halobacteriovoraceae bacterium]|tara:strand:+ start:8766 stop:10583 length:1818 start_codon:yes stop_codon:yes gene_type:complete